MARDLKVSVVGDQSEATPDATPCHQRGDNTLLDSLRLVTPWLAQQHLVALDGNDSVDAHEGQPPGVGDGKERESNDSRSE